MAMLLSAFVNANTQEGLFWGFGKERQAFHGMVFESQLPDFSQSAYAESVSQAFAHFSEITNKSFSPDTQKRVGIKVYTLSGTGLQTPQALTRAVIDELLNQGFNRNQIFIWDVYEDKLRQSGYLPPLSQRKQGDLFYGVPVFALEWESWQNDQWFYENPLPREFTSPLGREILQREIQINPESAHKSFLPVTALTQVDFWINLPVGAHFPQLGVSSALINATIANISNGERFFGSPNNAPVAIAEILAIPELQDTLALNILSLEKYQYIAGPHFNAQYTLTEPTLYASVDPIILDAILIQKVNVARQKFGFIPFPHFLPSMEAAVQLNLGHGSLDQLKKIP